MVVAGDSANGVVVVEPLLPVVVEVVATVEVVVTTLGGAVGRTSRNFRKGARKGSLNHGSLGSSGKRKSVATPSDATTALFALGVVVVVIIPFPPARCAAVVVVVVVVVVRRRKIHLRKRSLKNPKKSLSTSMS